VIARAGVPVVRVTAIDAPELESEGFLLLTTDEQLNGYGSSVKRV